MLVTLLASKLGLQVVVIFCTTTRHPSYLSEPVGEVPLPLVIAAVALRQQLDVRSSALKALRETLVDSSSDRGVFCGNVVG